MFSKIKKLFYMSELPLKDRVLRIILAIGEVIAFLAMVQGIFVTKSLLMVFPTILLVLCIILSTVILVRRNTTQIPAFIFGIVFIGIVFPIVFFLNGGINGGATVWFTLSIVYSFLMFEGKSFIFMLLYTFVVTILLYVYSYNHPDAVVALPSKHMIYFDSIFSVIFVGLICGFVVKFQSKVYDAERRISDDRQEELKKIGNSKNAFFANMSHEIRTPINTIVGLNELILRENTNESIYQNAENIKVASNMLLHLVNDILDLSQLEAKRMEIIPCEYGICELLGDIIDLMGIQIKEKKLELFVDVDKELPSVLWGDSKRIKQILINIISNAIKYTKEGSITISIRGERIEGDAIIIKMSVIDTGIGIKKEEIDFLYDSFKRVDIDKNRKIEGTGLGLTITKQLVDMMDGEITVDSVYTKGSTFTVMLEQRVVNKKPIGVVNFADRVKKRQRVQYKQSFESPEARILIVDDNEMNLLVTKKLLAATKMQIETALSGEECLELTKHKYYDVILMDHLMPGMDGIDTQKAVRRQDNGLCRDVPIIALTSNTFPEAESFYRKKGFDGYVDKVSNGVGLEKKILEFLPDSIVEYRSEKNSEPEESNYIKMISVIRKKPILITTDCVCDVPDDLKEKYNIKIMNLYIQTDRGRFRDNVEIDSDSLYQYLDRGLGTVRADGASVQEYQDFFADALTEAERVIHISLASNTGVSYSTAKEAAESFDHVYVIDSGHISGGLALVVLGAAKMALEGAEADDIIEKISEVKNQVVSYFVMPDVRSFYQNGYTTYKVKKICEAFSIAPVLKMRRGKLKVVNFGRGKLDYIWRSFVKCRLSRKRRINTDVVFLSHVGLTSEEIEYIKKEIDKHMKFDLILCNKTSVSCGCNAGVKTIALSYMTKGSCK